MNVGKKILCIAASLCLICESMFGGGTVNAKTTTVKLNISKKTIKVGSSFRLKVRGSTSGKTVLKWKSSNKKVAVVSSKGKVTGKKAGKANIIVKVAGKKGKAVCKVTVQKKKAGSTAKPEQTTSAPGSTDISVSSAPSATKTPLTTETPSTTSPAATEAPSSGPKTADPSVLVVSQSLVEIDGVTMTAYLINKNYNGRISVSLNGKSYTYSDEISGKDLLLMLKKSYTPNAPKMNHDQTISLYRGEGEEYWTVADLELNKQYYLKADRTNTLDPSWADCGVIYVKGDVRTEMGFQTITQ